MNSKVIFAAAMLAFAPAAEAATVVAANTSFIGSTVVRNILTGAGAPQTDSIQPVEQFGMDRLGGTSATQLVGSELIDFFAWCIEPREVIEFDVPITYTLVPLSQAATNIGGIGATKADQVRELFGRFNPDFATPITAQKAGALQIALWEIVRETAGNPLDIYSGNIFFAADIDSAPGMLALASSYVGAIDGTGPRAKYLKALVNGTPGVQGSGFQDLLVQGVPEPQTWAMLITGFGLVGIAARRRNRAVAA